MTSQWSEPYSMQFQFGVSAPVECRIVELLESAPFVPPAPGSRIEDVIITHVERADDRPTDRRASQPIPEDVEIDDIRRAQDALQEALIGRRSSRDCPDLPGFQFQAQGRYYKAVQ